MHCRVGKWQLIGLPCSHATPFIGHEGVVWETYLHQFYYTARYRLAYSATISPLLDKTQWKCMEPGIVVRLPDAVRPLGDLERRGFDHFMSLIEVGGLTRAKGAIKLDIKQEFARSQSKVLV